MTEEEWLACENVDQMLGFLQDQPCERKIWLFACAICRRIPGYLDSTPDRLTLEAAERHFDGVDSSEEMHEYFPETNWDIRFYRLDPWNALSRALESIHDNILLPSTAYASEDEREQASARAWAELANLLRELVGNPFRPVPFKPAWRIPAVTSLAQGIYDDRRFQDLPILADALEEAGCTITDLLSHLRGPGPHVRGCWALDLVLGKS
jgi:hypothetical protein